MRTWATWTSAISAATSAISLQEITVSAISVEITISLRTPAKDRQGRRGHPHTLHTSTKITRSTDAKI